MGATGPMACGRATSGTTRAVPCVALSGNSFSRRIVQTHHDATIVSPEINPSKRVHGNVVNSGDVAQVRGGLAASRQVTLRAAAGNGIDFKGTVIPYGRIAILMNPVNTVFPGRASVGGVFHHASVVAVLGDEIVPELEFGSRGDGYGSGHGKVLVRHDRGVGREPRMLGGRRADRAGHASELRMDNGFLVAPSGTDVDRHFMQIVRNHLACSETSPFPKRILKGPLFGLSLYHPCINSGNSIPEKSNIFWNRITFPYCISCSYMLILR